MEYLLRPLRVATSPPARRTYLGTILFLATSFILLCIAVLAYLVFYFNYVPQKLVSVPIHLQYNAGLSPFGIADLASTLMLEQAYDVTVDLTLPRSPVNLERGNFMVALYALRSLPDNPASAFRLPSDPYEHVTASNVVFASRRPALIPYEDPLVSTASRLLFLLYHIIFPSSEQVTLTVPMGELVDFKDVLPLSILLDVQAGQTLQVYSATVTLVARLRGLRWLMYNHRVISFVVCTTVFWLFEIVSTLIAWLALAYVVSNQQPKTQREYGGKGVSRGGELAGRRAQQDYAGQTDHSRGSDAQVKNELEASSDDIDVKQEEAEDEVLAGLSRHGGDADDEEEDLKDLGPGSTGSALHDVKGAGSLRRRSSQKGRMSS
ncbi:putative adipose-regulatory protein-domain-containing protein [Microdochium trichocladiopsis]|uniref:Adipose-regulatory protein-domain-containing protein n=1 Tax=Microdochium trichocladiopsis TaxID=1682393 RepID=A0A9P8XYS6_9PEZI|nr:putative adipose-regulatory protein-domain-containing protein [Microdochium trichocladiopsis]KAH7021023.1 putative adipose-regulatory protein-domain-containing protein [Microdochium trichocladiopsis]